MADQIRKDEALLMIRSMIAAAYGDGALTQDERGRFLHASEASGATPGKRAAMERQIANPRPLDALLAQVDEPEKEAEFQLASRAGP